MATGWQPRYKPGSEFGNHEFTALCRHCGWFAKNDQFSLGVAEMVRAEDSTLRSREHARKRMVAEFLKQDHNRIEREAAHELARGQASE